jgi:aryl-alcohol dehydrogenase-like predicted oxidoreductase
MRQTALPLPLSRRVITAPIVDATQQRHLNDALASVNVKLSGDAIISLNEPNVPDAVVGFV